MKDILYKVSINAVQGSTERLINAIQFDSRKIQNSDLFVAQKGLIFDGHKFIDKAIELGATVIICEEFPVSLSDKVTYVKVECSNEALAIIASNFYNNPSSKLRLIGVTGTNGKTTIATLLYNLFQNAGFKTGLLSTVKVLVSAKEYVATHTTPDSLSINKYLNEINTNNVRPFVFIQKPTLTPVFIFQIIYFNLV